MDPKRFEPLKFDCIAIDTIKYLYSLLNGIEICISLFKDTNVVTTLAVIVWLRSKFSERHDEWELIENKAFAWLRPKLFEQTTLDGSLELVKQTLWINGL